MGPKIGYFGLESFSFGFHGFEDHSLTQNSVSQCVAHKLFVSTGGFSANSLEISEEKEIKKIFVHKYLTNLKSRLNTILTGVCLIVISTLK